MKQKLKLGFTDTHDHLAQFFYHTLSKRYDITIDNDTPEFLIFGDENFGTENTKFSKRDCTKIFYTGENRRPENYDCHYAISFDHNFNNWHYRLPLYVIYMWALENIHKTKYRYDYILDPTVKEKTDFCSFVVSNPNAKERNNFFETLNAIKRVDSAGKHLKNIEVDLAGEEKKIEFLSSRKFNICFESMSHTGYVTEKILHAFYAGTVPIYWGSQTIGHDFNTSAFINVHNFRSFDDAAEYVVRVDGDKDLYNFIVNQPKYAYNIPPSYYFLDNFLNWFDSIVYKKRDTRDENTRIYF
jgi:hypothetical protein